MQLADPLRAARLHAAPLVAAVLAPILAAPDLAAQTARAPIGISITDPPIYCPKAPAGVLEGPGAVADWFGSDAVIADGKLLVGCPGDDTNANDAGSVRIHERTATGWVEVGRLDAAVPAADERFGTSLDLDGSRLVVGAPGGFGAGGTLGSVYVFELGPGGTWTQVARVAPAVPMPGGRFGQSVALHGSTLAVGAPFEDTANASVGGAVYAFARDPLGNWDEIDRLTAFVANGQIFGASVDTDGTRILVGAPYLAAMFVPGKAFVFAGGPFNWFVETELQSPISLPRDRFGAAVALVDDVAYVGSPNDLPPTIGHVESYRLTSTLGFPSWEHTATTYAPEPQPFDRFGAALDADGRRLAVGAYSTDDGDGAAYVFETDARGTTSRPCRLPMPETSPYAALGSRVRLFGAQVLSGAPEADGTATDSGLLVVHDALFGLGSTPLALSHTTGGTVHFQLDAGPEFRGRAYVMLGSASGTIPSVPGLPLVPLAFDGYTQSLLLAPNTFLVGSLGRLDDRGRSRAALDAGAQVFDPFTAGAVLHHAFVVLDPLGALDFVSNPVPTVLAP